MTFFGNLMHGPLPSASFSDLYQAGAFFALLIFAQAVSLFAARLDAMTIFIALQRMSTFLSLCAGVLAALAGVHAAAPLNLLGVVVWLIGGTCVTMFVGGYVARAVAFIIVGFPFDEDNHNFDIRL